MLRVRELSVRFQTVGGSCTAVDRVSFDLERGGSLALVGESGSGKTSIALSLMGLLPPGAAASGRVELHGRNLADLTGRELARVRGRQMAMVFHDPLAALNPVLRAGTQIGECLRLHRSLAGHAAREEIGRVLRRVGLDAAVARLYPHQLSGGMRQRVLIAMALACGPALLVADEPSSSLDPVTRAAMVDLLRTLRCEEGIALLVATHDPGLAAALCERIAVLYGGRIVEQAPAADLLSEPRHPYTAGLWNSLPPELGAARAGRLRPIPGSPPDPWIRSTGCRFRDRCARADGDCAQSEPELIASGRDHQSACFHPLEAA